ncbi:MAG: YifB family Mg chelatase-like AAA ATPase [Alphaproteobacteria bacterium]|nr:YifB family Mg chelatase-like AAA ATPase [Alphaproteobacteria bacterium]
MVAHVSTVTFQGLEVTPIDVQVQIGSGLPAFMVVGLPDKAVGESRERVRAALTAMGLALPAKRITVNLSPADLQKEGSHFDLPIALGILMAMGVVPEDMVAPYIVLGELALDGALLPVAGVLPAAMGAAERGRGILCPAENGSEACWAGNLDILAPATLLALLNHFRGTQLLSPPVRVDEPAVAHYRDLADIRGQETARRALEIAAAGGHNLLMSGPPGSGKSLLASCLPGILPPLSSEEILETSMIASVAGKLTAGKLCASRPYRDPHHSTSTPAMVGGGKRPKPGEISLAHNGVLFLDELPEFPRAVLEALRQPIETGTVAVARAQAHVEYPARFQLVAAMNPCRCGYISDAGRGCGRAPKCASEYQSRLSGPLLDRIDLHVEVPEVPVAEMFTPAAAESSAAVAARVRAARMRQQARFHKTPYRLNAHLSGEKVQEYAAPDAEGRALMTQAAEKMRLSMRGMHRVLKVALSIADLEGAEQLRKPHIAEALSFRARVGTS